MEPVETALKTVSSLAHVNKRIVAMCLHNDNIFVATEYEVFKYDPKDNTWTQLKFEVIA